MRGDDQRSIRRAAWITLAVITVGFAALTLGPLPIDLLNEVTSSARWLSHQTLDTPTNFPSRPDVERACNVCAFVPFGLILYPIFASRWSAAMARVITLLFAASSCVEVIQSFHPGRTPSVVDILLNTGGGAMGAGLARLATARQRGSLRDVI